MNHAQTKIRTFKEDGYLSLLQYPSTGIDLLSSRIKRKWKYLLRGLNIRK
jgi:hypothetical protein